jgi:hypothetical protein
MSARRVEERGDLGAGRAGQEELLRIVPTVGPGVAGGKGDLATVCAVTAIVPGERGNAGDGVTRAVIHENVVVVVGGIAPAELTVPGEEITAQHEAAHVISGGENPLHLPDAKVAQRHKGRPIGIAGPGDEAPICYDGASRR